jgi:CHAT domain-containing protein
MYATVRIPGFETVSSSFFGAQATQVPVKPTPDVQKLFDAAAMLPIPEQKAAVEKALYAALAARDVDGSWVAVRSLRELIVKTQSKATAVMYLESLLVNAKAADDNAFQGHVYKNLAILQDDILELDAAMTSYQKALENYRVLNYRLGIASSLDYIAFFHKDNAKSLSMHEESLAIWREIGDKSAIATILTRIAVIYETGGDIAKAAVLREEALSTRRALRDKSAIVMSLESIGHFYERVGNLAKAIVLREEELAMHRESGDKDGIGGSLYEIAYLHMYRGDLDKALMMFEESMSIWRERGGGYITIVAGCLIGIANIYTMRGDMSKALAMHEEALAVDREFGQTSSIPISLHNIANIHVSRGDLAKALALYEEALGAYRKVHGQSGVASTMREIAFVHMIRGDLADALLMLEESLAIQREHGTKRAIAGSLASLADMRDLLGQTDAASKLRAESARLFEELGDRLGQAFVGMGEGDALLRRGDGLGALAAYTRVRDLRAAAGVPIWSQAARMGEALLAIRKHLDALALLTEAVRAAEASGVASGLPRVLRSLAAAQAATGAGDTAMESYRASLAAAGRIGSPEDEAEGCAALSRLWTDRGNLPMAILLGKKAVDARQRQRTGAAELDESSRASFSNQVAPDYKQLADLLSASGRLAEAEEVLALLKSSEIRASGGGTTAARPLARTASEAEADAAYEVASAEMVALGARLRFLEGVKAPTPELQAERLALLKKIESAEATFNREFDRVVGLVRDSGATAGRADQLKDSKDGISRSLLGLPAGTAAVYLLCLRDSVRFLVVTPSVRVLRTVRVDERTLGERIRSFRDALTNPSVDPRPASWGLYDLLWKPVVDDLRRLGVKQVLLSLDGPVRYVPMGALHDGAAYVAQRWNLSLFTPTERDRLTERPSRRWDVLVAGMSGTRTVDDGLGARVSFPGLPGVRAEASQVRRALGGGPAPLLDAGFDVDGLRIGLLARPKVVHLASHFSFRPGVESASFLLTGKGEVLRVSDTKVLTPVLFRSVELLTLSACQTGMLSATSDGREVESIAAILQRRGAAAVLATLWPVADASTAAFMATFYGLRAADPSRTKAWCLRETQLRMIRGEVAPPGSRKPASPSRPVPRGVKVAEVRAGARYTRDDWSHPYHWAPFILQGNPL